jgi:hypothetical protein
MTDVMTYYDLPRWYRLWFSLRMLFPVLVVNHIVEHLGWGVPGGTVEHARQYADARLRLRYGFEQVRVYLSTDEMVFSGLHHTRYDGEIAHGTELFRRGQWEKHLAVLCWRADVAESDKRHHDCVADDDALFPEYASKEDV